MSRIQKAVKNDIQALKLLRDEALLHAHLFRGEVGSRWHELEHSGSDLQEHVARAKVATKANRAEVEAATKLLAETLRTSYVDFRNALKH